MTDDTIHTCSYSCERPGCIRAQRDELRDRLEALIAAQRQGQAVALPKLRRTRPSYSREEVQWVFGYNAALDDVMRLNKNTALAALAQQPASAGEEIMVNTPYDVFTLPLQPSGLSSGPRFVVHVPGPQQPAAVDGAARRRDVRLWMRHNAGSYSTATELAEAAAEVFNLPDGGLDNETHWVWDEAVEAINDAQREELS